MLAPITRPSGSTQAVFAVWTDPQAVGSLPGRGVDREAAQRHRAASVGHVHSRGVAAVGGPPHRSVGVDLQDVVQPDQTQTGRHAKGSCRSGRRGSGLRNRRRTLGTRERRCVAIRRHRESTAPALISVVFGVVRRFVLIAAKALVRQTRTVSLAFPEPGCAKALTCTRRLHSMVQPTRPGLVQGVLVVRVRRMRRCVAQPDVPQERKILPRRSLPVSISGVRICGLRTCVAALSGY